MSSRDRSVNLADETWGQLAEIARSQDRSVSWLVRAAIDQYLSRRDGPPILDPKINGTMPFDDPVDVRYKR